jgi:hypothetical protein
MTNTYNKNVLIPQLVGVPTFVVISFFQGGLDSSRSIESYLIPILVGFIVAWIQVISA